MSNIELDKTAFFRRLKRLYSAWKEPSGSIKHDEAAQSLGKVDCMMTAVGADEETIYSKSTALQTWLFGYELTDTISIFCAESVYFLASKKKIEFLKQVENAKEDGVPQIKLLVREKNDKDKANFEKLIEVIKASKEGKVMGVFPKDNFPGEFCESWRAALKKESFETVDLSAALAYVMSAKDDNEVLTVKKASLATVDVFTKYLKDQIMEIIDADKKIKHSKLAEGVEAALTDKKYITGVDTSQLDMCYPAIIQSGGNYSLKFSATSDKNILHFGAIVCSLGARYKSYCSNIVRTLLVNPSETIQAYYTFLVNLEEEIIKNLVPDKKLSEVYEKSLAYATKEQPKLLDRLTKTFGFAMGIEFRENSLVIGPKCTALIQKGMVFNVNVGLSGISNKDASDKEGKVYALFIGDTVLVNEEPPASVLTNSKKKIKNMYVRLCVFWSSWVISSPPLPQGTSNFLESHFSKLFFSVEFS